MIVQGNSLHIPLKDKSVPCVVFDPFSGSGTTVQVAQDFGRRGVGLEMSGEYLGLARVRTAQGGLGI